MFNCIGLYPCRESYSVFCAFARRNKPAAVDNLSFGRAGLIQLILKVISGFF